MMVLIGFAAYNYMRMGHESFMFHELLIVIVLILYFPLLINVYPFYNFMARKEIIQI